ncbi:MAG: hypothetical protein V4531_11970 [Actinomycetota bacterium]
MTKFELPHEVDLELACVLVGIMRRTVGTQRSLSLGQEISTVPSCPVLNEAVRNVSGLGSNWDDLMTWRLIEEELTGAPHSNEKVAILALLALGEFGGIPQGDRRVAAIEALRLSGSVKPESIRIKYKGDRATYDSEVLQRVVPVLRNLIQSAMAPNRLQSRARSLMVTPLAAPALQQLSVDSALRRLEAAPSRLSHYPPRLTTSVLVGQLSIHEEFDEPEPSVDRIPVLPKPIESLDVEELAWRLQNDGARVSLRGGPGYGKSTFIRGVAIARLLDGLPTLLVSALSLAERASEAAAPDHLAALSMAVDACRASLGLTFAGDEREYVAALAADPNLCLLVDGLDEVPAGLRQGLEDLLQELDALQGSILVSARVGSRIPATSEWSPVQMGHFSAAREFIDLWFDGVPNHPGRALAQATLDNPEYARVHDSPLLVGFIAQVSELQRTFTTISDLYDQYVILSLERSWKGKDGAAFDDALIFRLRGIAQAVAWQMATGESRSQDEAEGWRGEASLAEVLEYLPERDHELAVALLQVESLFVVSGGGATRLHTTYSWTHRTIQEHLVGVQLVESLRFDEGAEKIVTLAIDPDGWTTSLVHAISEFDAKERFRTLKALKRVGGAKIDRLLAKDLIERIIRSSPEDPALWQWLVESAATIDDFDQAMQLFPKRAHDTLLAYFKAESRPSVEFPWLLFARLEDDSVSPDWLDALEEATEPLRGASEEVRKLAFQIRSSFAPDTAVLNYIEALRKGDVVGVAGSFDEQFEISDFDSLNLELDSLEWPEPRWRAVTTMLGIASPSTRKALLSRPNGDEEVALSELMVWMMSVDPTDAEITVDAHFGTESDALPGLVARALSGEYGDAVAYLVARRLPVKDATKMLGGTTSLWAGVAYLERSFADGNLPASAESVSDDLRTVRLFDASWLSDPRQMIHYLEALQHLHRTHKPVAAEELLYGQLRVHEQLLEIDANAASLVFSVDNLDHMISSYFSRIGFDSFLATLLDTNARDWLPLGGKVPALMELWRDGVGWLSPVVADHPDAPRVRHMYEEERFRRVVNWGARGGLPVLRSLDALPLHMSIQLEYLLQDVDPKVFEIPENLDWIDDRQAHFQGLQIWKARREPWLARMKSRAGIGAPIDPTSVAE